MITTKRDVADCFDTGVREGFRWMLIVCDTVEHEEYPFYIESEMDFWKEFFLLQDKQMQHVMEVYDLAKDRNSQLAEHRSWNVPLL